eukprot:TRINITY_DN70075_c0_g1_i1.p2 TRINITY_DN70075_c0_g1~~TRINITY_DN70075_c0_g1_i1.p2  ORF type:complete len:473 (+),score=149.75 TRINITY_DN70075_c0_g1_i1:84-1502(+)
MCRDDAERGAAPEEVPSPHKENEAEDDPAEGDHAAPLHVSLFSVTATMSKTAMGVGVLALGGGYALCGLAAGVALTVFGGGLCMQALYLLLVAARASGEQTFEGLIQRTLGERARWAFQADLLVMYFTTAIGDLVPSKHFLQKAASHAFQGTDIADWTPNVFLLVCVAIVLPVSMLRNMDSLRFTSLLGVTCVLAWIGASASYFADHQTPHRLTCDELTGTDAVPEEGGVDWFNTNPAELLQGFAVITVSFVCHPSILNLFAEVRRTEAPGAAYSKCRNGAAFAVVLVTTCYVAVASLGYLTWRDVSPRPSTILACYPSGKPLWIAMYLAMTALCLCSFPIRAFSPRKTLEVIAGREFTVWERLLYCVMWTGAAAGGAAASDNLVKIVALCGALSVPLMCYLLPALAFFGARRQQQESGGEEAGLLEAECRGPEAEGRSLAGTGLAVTAWTLLAAGVVIQAALLYAAVRLFV